MNTSTTTVIEKGPIFVSGADGDKGYAIVRKLLDTPKELRLENQEIFASVVDKDTLPAKEMTLAGAKTLTLDIFKDTASVTNELKKAVKLVLVLDPLNKRIKQNNIYEYGKKLIDAAKKANIQHVIFLTPFSRLDPLSPPNTPIKKPQEQPSPVSASYRSQFMMVQSYLQTVFEEKKITLICYPGILHQHLIVFKNYIKQNNAFPLPDKYLESSIESSNLEDIARAAAYISYSPTSRHGGKQYKLTGPQLLTLKEVSTNVLSGLGHDVCVNTMDDQNLKEILAQSVNSKDQADFLMEIWGLQQQPAGRTLEITRDMEALTGQSGKTLKEFFQDDNVFDKFHSATMEQPLLL